MLNLVLSLFIGYGFAYATYYLSPLGRIKFKPFSCPDCLTFWGGCGGYYLLDKHNEYGILIAIGFVALVAGHWFRMIESVVVRGRRVPVPANPNMSQNMGPCSPCSDKGGKKDGERIRDKNRSEI